MGFRIAVCGELLSMRVSAYHAAKNVYPCGSPKSHVFAGQTTLTAHYSIHPNTAINQSGSCSLALVTAQRLGEADLVACQATLMGGEMIAYFYA